MLIPKAHPHYRLMPCSMKTKATSVKFAHWHQGKKFTFCHEITACSLVLCILRIDCFFFSVAQLHKAGKTVQMSSLLLGDPTKPYFKLTLWREAAVWVERITAGDITYFKSMLLSAYRMHIGTPKIYSIVPSGIATL